MSIAAKQQLIKSISAELSDIVTANEINNIYDKLNNILSIYDVEVVCNDKIDSNSEDCLSAFLEAKEIEGRSEKTVERYRYLISKMLHEINIPIRQISVFNVRSFLMKKKDLGISDKTLEGMRSVYCSFFGWLQKEGLLQCNPCANLSPIKCAKKVRLPYSAVDIERIKESCTCSRDKALISFLLSTGCRIGEVCSLNRNNVDYQTKEATVLGKGNKERTVFIDDVTAMFLSEYNAERKDSSVALFAGKGTDRMTPGGVRAMLNKVAARASVNNVHPHRFRRTLATNLINHGMMIQDVATILGHEKLDTTMKYVYISHDNVKSSYRKYL